MRPAPVTPSAAQGLSECWSSFLAMPGALRSAATGWLWLAVCLFIANRAGTYATEVAGPAVPDLILDHLPMRDISVVHVVVASSFWVLVFGWLLWRPHAHPFATRAFAVFVAVRSFFVCLTHLGPPENQLMVTGPAELLLFTGDLFFSGHVGSPLLLSLIFWHERVVRWLGLVASLVFAFVVLLGHVHYSTDVFGAVPITWAIYASSRRLFWREHAMLVLGSPTPPRRPRTGRLRRLRLRLARRGGQGVAAPDQAQPGAEEGRHA